MEHIIESIKNYLKREETDYAVMITGEWGSGKTYFWENELKNIVSHTPIPNSQKTGEEYIPIYLSLYGFDRIEKINEEIGSLVFFQNSKSKKIIEKSGEFITSLAGAIEKKYVGSELVKPLKDVFDQYKKDPISILNTKKYVLCFDDFERSKISNIELLGYINLFAVTYKMKTLIICNEEKIDKKKPTEETDNKLPFDSIKEKTIVITLKYHPELNDTIQNIIANVTKESKIFKNNNNKKECKEILLKQVKYFELVLEKYGNIRILKRVLQNFCEVFVDIKNSSDKYINIVAKKVILDLTFISHIYYLGKCKEIELFEFNNIFSKKVDSEIKQVMEDIYFGFTDRYSLINPLVTMVLDGRIDKNEFQLEIKSIVRDEKYKEGNSSLKNLYNFVGMKGSDFKNDVDKIIEQIKNNEIDFYEYLRLYDRFICFVSYSLIDLKYDEVDTLFRKGLNAAKQNATYRFHDSSSFFPSNDENEYSKKYNSDFRNYYSRLKNELKDNDEKSKHEYFLTELEKNNSKIFEPEFSHKGINFDGLEPVFDKLDIVRLVNILFKNEAPLLWEFGAMLYNRYERLKNAEQHFFVEEKALKQITEIIDEKIFSIDDLIIRYHLRKISDKCKKLSDKFSEYEKALKKTEKNNT
jgi:hypothetical protein